MVSVILDLMTSTHSVIFDITDQQQLRETAKHAELLLFTYLHIPVAGRLLVAFVGFYKLTNNNSQYGEALSGREGTIITSASLLSLAALTQTSNPSPR